MDEPVGPAMGGYQILLGELKLRIRNGATSSYRSRDAAVGRSAVGLSGSNYIGQTAIPANTRSYYPFGYDSLFSVE
jgi:hypothetical protein